jgi:hypothetical protein
MWSVDGSRPGSKMLRGAAGVAFGFAIAGIAFAAPGDLDDTFGRGGVVVTNVGWGGGPSSGRVARSAPCGPSSPCARRWSARGRATST